MSFNRVFSSYLCAIVFFCANNIFVTLSHAEEFEYLLSNPSEQLTGPPDPATLCWSLPAGQPIPSQCYWYSASGGKVIEVRARYNTVTKRLTMRSVLGPAKGTSTLPSSIMLIVNHGPMPWSVGLASIFFFDANNPANPKLSVYGYSASHDLYDRSWIDGDAGTTGNQAPDRICSSATGSCGTWINNLSVTTSNTNPKTRTFFFDIDATAILNHTPLYGNSTPSQWHRRLTDTSPRMFDSQFGMWFHPAINRSYSYNAAGYITNVNYSCNGTVGYFDIEKQITNVPPTCTVSISKNTVRPNESLPFTITGNDIDGIITSDTLTPSGQGNFSCSRNPVSGTSSTVTYSCTYTGAPTPGTSGSIQVNFTDSNDFNATCGAAINVVNQAPLCSISITEPQATGLACKGTTTAYSFSLAGTVDPDGDPLTKQYAVSCNAGSAQVSESGGTATVSLTGPGLGLNTSCTVGLTVNDPYISSNCSTAFQVNPCSRDCNGTALGSASFDLCGVCNGSNACFDCKGAPYGKTTIDRCGVCGGDGLSCLGCNTVTVSEQQLALDGLVGQQFNLIKRSLLSLGKYEKKSSSQKKFKDKILAEAKTQNVLAWAAIWGIPSTHSACTNTTFCITQSFSSNITTYSNSSTALDALIKSVVSRMKQKSNIRNAGKRLLIDAKKLATDIEKEKSAFPKSASVCS